MLERLLTVEGTSLRLKRGIKAGGQAVIEGVMMRSPRFLSIAVRQADGKIVLKEERWKSLSERKKVFNRPVFRGISTLVETVINGIQALSFSADIAAEEDKTKDREKGSKDFTASSEKFKSKGQKRKSGVNKIAMTFTILSAFALAIVLFVILPHVLTLLLGRLISWELDVNSLTFHIIDGIIKIAIFIAYIWTISLIKDVRRVFEYHGAEHKSIFAYELAESLSIESARNFSTRHPRCGTSFVLIVLIISIFLFSIVFPFFPQLKSLPQVVRHAIFMLVKIILLFPIAGISYEVIRISSKSENPILKALVFPGILLQKITTKEPDDSQIEIALLALISVLLRESEPTSKVKRRVRIFSDFKSALNSLEEEVKGSEISLTT